MRAVEMSKFHKKAFMAVLKLTTNAATVAPRLQVRYVDIVISARVLSIYGSVSLLSCISHEAAVSGELHVVPTGTESSLQETTIMIPIKNSAFFINTVC